MNFSFADAAVFFVAAVISSMGMGGGGILMLYTIYVKGLPQLGAQGLNLLFFLPCSVTAVIIYAKNRYIKPKAVLPILAGSVFGIAAGKILLNLLNPDTLKGLFAVFLTVSGLIMIFTNGKKDENGVAG